jgi:hypothetical protein
MPDRPKQFHALSSITPENSLNFPDDFGHYKVTCLPIISNFLQKLGVTELVDSKADSPQNISSGQVVAGMVMDTLSGRSPLYHLSGFFVGQDMELLFGSTLKPSDFNDDNVGEVRSNIHIDGVSKRFSKVSWQACQHYDLDSHFLLRPASTCTGTTAPTPSRAKTPSPS